jgi:hypothetical protein
MKISVSLKLYHKIDSLGAVGGCIGPTQALTRPATPTLHFDLILG